jgi:hypothetical protein
LFKFDLLVISDILVLWVTFTRGFLFLWEVEGVWLFRHSRGDIRGRGCSSGSEGSEESSGGE